MMRFIRNRRKGGKKSSDTPKSGRNIHQNAESGDEVILTGVKTKDQAFGANAYPGTDIKENGVDLDAKMTKSEKPLGLIENGVANRDGMNSIPEEHTSTQEELERLVASEPHYATPDIDGDLLEDEASVVTVIEKKPSTVDNKDSPVYATVKKLTPPLTVKAHELDDRYTPDKEYRERLQDPHQETRALLEAMPGVEEEEEEDEAADTGPPAKVEDYYIYVTEETLQKGPKGTGCVAMSTFAPTNESLVDAGAIGGPSDDRMPGAYRLHDREDSGQDWNNHEPDMDRYKQTNGQVEEGWKPRLDGRYVDRQNDRYPDDMQAKYSPCGRERREERSPETDYIDPENRRMIPDVEYSRPDDMRSSPEEEYQRPESTNIKDNRNYSDHYGRYDDPRPNDFQRQMSAPVPTGYNYDSRDLPSDEYGPLQRQNSVPYEHPQAPREYDYDPRQEQAYISERELAGPNSHGYESDRSDYDNYTRSYNNRRKRRRDELVVRYSPSGGYIERTNSMPLIRNEHQRHGYPSRRYGYPSYGPRGYRGIPCNYDPYREGHRRPRHGGHPRDRPHRELRPPCNMNGYPPRKRGQQPGYLNDHPLVHGQVIKAPNNQQLDPVRVEQEKLSRASPSESATSSSVSQKSARRQEQRVSFKEMEGITNNDEETTFPTVIENDVQNASSKALLAAEKDEDAVSVGSDTNIAVEDDQKPRRLLIRRSIAIWFAWLCMGFYTEVVGPNIPYLQSRINGTSSDVAISLASRGAGLLLGTSVGGLLCEVSPNWLDLWIATSLILGSLCASAVPWSLNLIHLCLTLGLSGFSKGFLQVATVTLAFRLWATKSVMYIIFLIHMAYAIGAAPCAQLAYLFDTGVLEKLLLGENGTLPAPQKTHTNGDPLVVADELFDEPTETKNEKMLSLLDYIPRPMYPFDIAAVLTFVCGALFLIFFGSAIRSVPAQSVEAKRKQVKDVEQQKLEGMKPQRWFLHGSCGFRAVLFIFVFFIMPMAILAIFGSFHHLYILHNVDKQLKSEALLIQTVFWAAVAIGRLVAMVSTRCLAPNGLTITCLTISIVSTALMWVYGEKYRVFVWIFTVLLGFSTGPLLPAGLTLCNVCISPTAMGVAVAFFFQALGDGIFSWTAGFLLHRFFPVCLMYVGLASVGVSFLLYLPIIPVLAKQSNWKNAVKNGKIPNGKAVG